MLFGELKLFSARECLDDVKCRDDVDAVSEQKVAVLRRSIECSHIFMHIVPSIYTSFLDAVAATPHNRSVYEHIPPPPLSIEVP